MKQIYLFLFAIASLSLNAQVADRMVEDCNTNQSSIYQVLASGKPLIVASKGFDCSICVNQAPGWGTWASNNPQVQVWGAMTNTYSSNIPTCNQVSSWVSSYNWSNIYTFIDSSEYFFEFGTPRYLVYDPADSSLAYVGGSASTARSTALGLVTNNVSLKENTFEDIQFYYKNGTLNFMKVPEGNTLIEIYNLTGKKERVFTLRRDHKSFPLSDLPKGIYLMRLSNSKSATTRKIVIS